MGFDPVTALVVALVGQAASSAKAERKGKKSFKRAQDEAQSRQVPIPTPEALEAESKSKATAALRKRRQTILRAGGQTQLTGPGGAPLGAGDVARKTLLGGA